MSQDTEDNAKSFLEIWEILRRRRYYFGLSAAAIVLLALLYALSLPDIYRSQATILIEDPEIPEDIIGSTLTNYASQQIQLISQRLLTVKNIQDVIERLEVYALDDSGEASPAQTNRFREDMALEVVSAEVLDSRGRASEAAVAFTLAFESQSPDVAQQVAEELVSLFMDENRRSSLDRSTGVSELLQSAIDQANERLTKAESELAVFKTNNEGALPELKQLNLNMINRAQQQLSDTNLRIQALEQRRLQLSAQLAPISPNAAITLPTGETIMSDRERLRVLLLDYQRKIAIYEPGHPDLVRLKREIETLQQTVGQEGTSDMVREQLRQERERLSGMRERYSVDHPDIKQSEAAIRQLELQLARSSSHTPQPEVADNPAYVLISTQLQSTDLELRSLFQKRQELGATIAKHEALMREAPRVEMQYDALMRTYENAAAKYRDLQSKLRAAEVAAHVGQEISGQRFTLIEPPARPLRPDSPNRTAIMIMAVILGIGVGAGSVVFVELTDTTIRSAKRLTQLSGARPLAVIPYLNNRTDIARARRRTVFLTSALIVGGTIYALYIYYVL